VTFPAGEGTIGFWGQLRFRPNGSQDVAVFMWRPTTKSPWQQVGDAVPTSFRGFFTGTVPVPGPGGEYRAVYVDPETGKVSHSSLPVPP